MNNGMRVKGAMDRSSSTIARSLVELSTPKL